MDIIFVTTAKTDAEAKALLKAFDIPFAGATARRTRLRLQVVLENRRARRQVPEE